MNTLANTLETPANAVILTPTALIAQMIAESTPLTQEQADAKLIETGLSHLTEDHYFDEESGNHYYDLEDGRTVEVNAKGEVFTYDFTKEDSEEAATSSATS